MRNRLMSLAAVAAVAFGLVPALRADHSRSRVSVGLSVDVGLFYDRLAPHGDWVYEPAGAWVWVPRVSSGWRPYTAGHWVWTDDCGWLWVSDERFGWAVYHYGRWRFTPAYGWVWYPGYEWAPAWVAWRYGDEHVGWAPLPPDVAWSMSVGLRAGEAELDARIEPRAYNFVPVRRFAETGLRRHVLPPERNEQFVRATRNATRYALVGQRVVNRGLEPARLERAGGRRIPRARVADVASVEAVGRRDGGDALPVFRPRVLPAADKKPPLPKRDVRAQAQAREQERLRREYERQRQADLRQAEQRRAELKQQERLRRELDRRRDAEQREQERRLARQREQHERDRRDLARSQSRERDLVEREHAREIKRPPRGSDPESVEARHEREHRAIEERHGRERRQLEAAREQSRQERADQQRGERRGREARAGDERRPEPKKKPEPKGRDKGAGEKKKPG